MNDVPAARQSRDDRAGVEPARIDSPRVHQKGKPPKKRTSHKDVRKYPMKSRLRVPNEENPSWTVGL